MKEMTTHPLGSVQGAWRVGTRPVVDGLERVRGCGRVGTQRLECWWSFFSPSKRRIFDCDFWGDGGGHLSRR